MTNQRDNRELKAGMTILHGLAAGILCYLLSEWLIPRQVATPGDHDIVLASRLGFIYTTAVGLWLAWVQRSWKRALAALVAGASIGWVYMWLCSGRDFFAIMVSFPALLGSGLAIAVGSNRSPWIGELGIRLLKGLLAGLVLGFVYMVVLSVAATMFTWNPDDVKSHTSMMWRAGPIALGISSALFFVLIKWAVGLSRVRVIVFEDVEQPPQTPSTPSV